MAGMSLLRSENGELVLPLEGLAIARCVIDYSFFLEASREHGVVVLRIECPFIVSKKGMQYVLEPNEPVNLGPG